MSVAAMNWVLENSEATLGARLVMIAIADAANQEGKNAWPSIARIARHSRLSPRRVKVLLHRLEASGELQVDRGAGPSGVHRYSLPLMRASRRTMRLWNRLTEPSGQNAWMPTGLRP
jgi:DNA-binding transcriptional regulator PaaX